MHPTRWLERLSRGAGAGELADFWVKVRERSHSNLYFALFVLDRDRQHAFRDVYRFVRAADDVADAPDVPDEIKLARLAQWRQQLDAIYLSRAGASAPGASPGPFSERGGVHAFAQRLTDTVHRYRLSREHFEQLLDGIARDLVQPRHPDTGSLLGYCQDVAAPLALLCLEILGVSTAAARAYARDVGVALQLANILRDIPEDAARGHIYLPQDRLRIYGVAEADLLAHRPSPGLAAVCAELEAEARARIEAARAALGPAERASLLVAEIWADVYLALLDELKRLNFDVFRRTPYLSRRRKLRLAAVRIARTRFGSPVRALRARLRL